MSIKKNSHQNLCNAGLEYSNWLFKFLQPIRSPKNAIAHYYASIMIEHKIRDSYLRQINVKITI